MPLLLRGYLVDWDGHAMTHYQLKRQEATMINRVHHSSLGMLGFLWAGSLQSVLVGVTERSLVHLPHSLAVVGVGMLLTALFTGKSRQSGKFVARGLVASLGWLIVGFLVVMPLVGVAPGMWFLRIILYTMAFGSAFGLWTYGRPDALRFGLLGLCFGAGLSLLGYAYLTNPGEAPLRGILGLNSAQLETVITYMASGGAVALGMSLRPEAKHGEMAPGRSPTRRENGGRQRTDEPARRSLEGASHV